MHLITIGHRKDPIILLTMKFSPPNGIFMCRGRTDKPGVVEFVRKNNCQYLALELKN